ncbi:MAG: HD domain-containing phosphohydrolase [bacterium]
MNSKVDEKVLFVDDEANILDSYRRQLRKAYNVETAQGAEQAISLIQTAAPFAVVISDLRMPGMDGIQFLARVRQISPNSVRMMLTGYADLTNAMEAVNEGNIFRFMTKPCPPDKIANALDAGIEQYRLIMSEKILLEKTLKGSIDVLTEVLSLVNPTAFGRASRIRRMVRQLGSSMRIRELWQLEIAAMLSQIGCVTIPEQTLSKIYHGKTLSFEELKMFQSHPGVGRDLISNIPRLEKVAAIIAAQEKRINEQEPQDNGKTDDKIPIEARILKLALDVDTLNSTGIEKREILVEIQKRSKWYDPSAVDALKQILSDENGYEKKSIGLAELTFKMVLAEDVRSLDGTLLISKGQEVSESLKIRLQNFEQNIGIRQPIKVLVPSEVRRDVVA